LRAAYRGIKGVRSDMPVLLAGMAPRIGRGLQWDRFLRRVYGHGAAAHSDDLSLHPYATEEGLQIAQVLGQVRQAGELVRERHPGASIWVTEMGFPHPPGGEECGLAAAPGELLTRPYRRLRQHERCGRSSSTASARRGPATPPRTATASPA
jgi:hypothetical protein